MYRRRYKPAEIHFSFDSFLDLVANVVGIIIRLILVAWIGARTYKGITTPGAAPAPPALRMEAEPSYSTDPEEQALAKLRADLASTEATLAKHVEKQQVTRAQTDELLRQLQQEQQQRQQTEQQQTSLQSQQQQTTALAQQMNVALADLTQRHKNLHEQMANLAKQPVNKKTFRYQTPVAEVVQSEELHFEVQQGKVSFVDIEAFTRDIKRNLKDKGEKLRSQWEVEARTEPIGGFRLKYIVSRERQTQEMIANTNRPTADASFSYRVDTWIVEPLSAERGEKLELSLQEASEFRRIVDRIDPEVTAVTFWVYPESFGVYRALRDYCVKRGILVAGRPLPPGQPIASSRDGTASKGQ